MFRAKSIPGNEALDPGGQVVKFNSEGLFDTDNFALANHLRALGYLVETVTATEPPKFEKEFKKPKKVK
jgi:hypothetical protein